MEFIPTSLPEVILIKPQIFRDERGFFLETYQQQQFKATGISVNFVQDNHSGSYRRALRGLHYQIQQPQGKLVRVVVGEIYDAAVDIRRSSPTFGQWVGLTLSAENKHQLWIPPGFAHGFLVLSEWAEIIYKATDYYAPQHERTIRWDDPQIGIDWPLEPGSQPVLSPKDSQGLPLSQAELYA